MPQSKTGVAAFPCSVQRHLPLEPLATAAQLPVLSNSAQLLAQSAVTFAVASSQQYTIASATHAPLSGKHHSFLWNESSAWESSALFGTRGLIRGIPGCTIHLRPPSSTHHSTRTKQCARETGSLARVVHRHTWSQHTSMALSLASTIPHAFEQGTQHWEPVAAG